MEVNLTQLKKPSLTFPYIQSVNANWIKEYMGFFTITLLLLTLLFIRFLTKRIILDGWGLGFMGYFDLSLATFILFSSLFTLGLSNPISRRFNDPKVSKLQKWEIILFVSILALIFSLVIGVLTLILRGDLFQIFFVKDTAPLIFLILFPIILFGLSMSRLAAFIFRAIHRGLIQIIINLIDSIIVLLLISLMFFIREPDIQVLIFSSLLWPLIIRGIIILWYWNKHYLSSTQNLNRKKNEIQVGQLNKFIKLWTPYSISELSLLLLSQALRYIIIFWHPENLDIELGFFSITFYFYDLCNIFFAGLSWIANPKIIKAALKSSVDLRDLMYRSTFFAGILGLLGIIITFFFGSDILSLAFGIIYSYRILITLIVISVTFRWLPYALVVFYIARDKVKFIAVSNTSTSIFGFIISFYLFPILGLTGIGWGLFIGNFSLFLIYGFFFLNKGYHREILGFKSI